MTKSIEITGKAAEKLTQAAQKTQKTIDEFILLFADKIADAIISDEQTTVENNVAWTEEEIRELIQPEPLTGKEMVEGGFVGGWEHKDIDDPVVFLQQQRANRRQNKFSW